MDRISEEKRIIEKIIYAYCRRKHSNAPALPALCPDCEQLLEYARARLDKCFYGNDKPACKHCPIHCYKPLMREKMREGMRWAGPRMFFIAPGAAFRHLWKRQKPKAHKQNSLKPKTS